MKKKIEFQSTIIETVHIFSVCYAKFELVKS
jgi:hypothetical protein